MPDDAPLIRPAAFKDAVRKLNDKLPVTSVLKSREWSMVPVAIRERAFFSARVENARFLQAARDGIDDFLKSEVEETDGGKALKAGGRERFVRIMREKMAEQGMPIVGPHVGGVIEPTSTGRLRLIFETQTTMANDYAYFKHGNEDPAIRRAFPAQRFIREMPTPSPRRSHDANDGVVKLKSDLAFWLSMNAREIGGFGVPYGPWGFNSGMGVEDVGRSEAIARGLMKADDPTPPPVPEEGFNADVIASTNGIDPDIMRQLEKALGPKAKRKKDTIKLVPATEAMAAPLIPPMSVNFSLLGRPDKEMAEEFHRTLDAIDSVHGDGDMPKIGARLTAGKFTGKFGIAELNDCAIRVWKNPYCGTGNTVAHEIGHQIHWHAFGKVLSDSQFANHPVLSEFYKAVTSTRYYAGLVAKYGRGSYVPSMREIWARSYAQYITEKSGDAALMKDLEEKFTRWDYYKIPGEEWGGISAGIEHALRMKGWMK